MVQKKPESFQWQLETLTQTHTQKVPFAATYLSAVGAAWCAELVSYPFDLTKTRMQLQGEVTSKGGNDMPHRGMVKTLYGIAAEEGVLKLYNGITVMLMRHTGFSGLKMLIYDYARKALMLYDADGKENFTIFRSAVAGTVSGGLACIATSPTDLVKVQMQMDSKRVLMGLPRRNKSVADAFVNIYKTGGIPGLWKGTVPNALRAASVTIGEVGFYDISKRKIIDVAQCDDGRLIQFTAAMFAGLMSVLLSSPFDVVKARIMNQPTDEQGRGMLYKNTLDCAKKLLKDDGPSAFYKGALPYWVRVGPWSLAFWMSYEQIRHAIGYEAF